MAPNLVRELGSILLITSVGHCLLASESRLVSRAGLVSPTRAVSRKSDGFGGERTRLLKQLDASTSGEAVAEVLELLRTSGMGADVESYGAGIVRCAALPSGSDWALLLLDEMAALALQPDAACFSGALAAAIAAEQRSQIEQLLERAQASRVQLDLADVCAAISAVHALSDESAPFVQSYAGRLWAGAVLPALLGEGSGLLSLTGCSVELALEAVWAALEQLVERQLDAGHSASAVKGALRVRFGGRRHAEPGLAAASSDAPPAARGVGNAESGGNADGVDQALCAVERALGSAANGWPALPWVRERARIAAASPPDGSSVADSSAEGSGAPRGGTAAWDLVISQAALEGWVRARCLGVWLAATDRAVVSPMPSRGGGAERKSAGAGHAAGQGGRAAAASPSTAFSARESPVSILKGVGVKRQEQLAAVGLMTVGQLAALVDDDLEPTAVQSGCPAGMLVKYVDEARRLLSQ